MWERIWEKRPVWHLDATGSVHVDVAGKSILWYSLVGHYSVELPNGANFGLLVPIFEFALAQNDEITISRHLSSFKFVFAKQLSDDMIANVTVTDFSWALINSSCKVCRNALKLIISLVWLHSLP